MPIPPMRTCTVEQGYTEAGETVLGHRRVLLTAGVLLLTLSRAAVGQESAISPDTARAQIRSVLRAYYMHFENRNWDALSPYVLSPKLLERRGAPGQVETVARDRTRGRGASHPASAPRTCPGKALGIRRRSDDPGGWGLGGGVGAAMQRSGGRRG